jgi:hypothetical protein
MSKLKAAFLTLAVLMTAMIGLFATQNARSVERVLIICDTKEKNILMRFQNPADNLDWVEWMFALETASIVYRTNTSKGLIDIDKVLHIQFKVTEQSRQNGVVFLLYKGSDGEKKELTGGKMPIECWQRASKVKQFDFLSWQEL